MIRLLFKKLIRVVLLLDFPKKFVTVTLNSTAFPARLLTVVESSSIYFLLENDELTVLFKEVTSAVPGTESIDITSQFMLVISLAVKPLLANTSSKKLSDHKGTFEDDCLNCM